MNLSELIYKRLCSSPDLTKTLARYNGSPAIFSPEAPDDNMEGWEEEVQYPKIVYSYDLIADEKRQSTGNLTITLLCRNDAEVMPEHIEVEIIKSLRDVMIMPDNGIPYCFAWSRTERFTIQEKSVDVTIGSEIRFDIIEYPSQITTDPDPIWATCRYIKDLYPESVMIGLDRLEEITEVTKDHPVIYCRLRSMENTGINFTTAWMDANISIHVICPESDARLGYLSGINMLMATDGEIELQDESPMHIHYLKMNNATDYLKNGQITFTGKYGALRYRAKEKPLNVMNNTLNTENKGGARWVVRKRL